MSVTSIPVAVGGEIRIDRRTLNPWVELDLVRALRRGPACAFLAGDLAVPRLGNAVFSAGFDVVSVAHSGVFAHEPEEVTARLEHANVRCVGWGAEPYGPVFVRRRGQTLGVCAAWIPDESMITSLGKDLERTPILSSGARFIEALEAARAGADHVVAFIDQGSHLLIADAVRAVLDSALEHADIIALSGAYPGEMIEGTRGRAFIPGTFHDVARSGLVVGQIATLTEDRFELLPIRQSREDGCTTERADDLLGRILADGTRGVVAGGRVLRRAESRLQRILGRKS